MSKIDDLFRDLRKQGRKALMPFLTAGDPDLDFTCQALIQLGQVGASLCEVGIPYSDPIADGPVIQASYQRALDQGIKLADIMDRIGHIAPKLTMPLVTMVSYAIIHRRGLDNFVATAKKSGFSGAIVPDLLVEEAGPLRKVCEREDFSLIQLVTPTTPRERQKRIAEMTSGFIYFVSVTGITGERTELPADLLENVQWLRQQTPLPVCIGFGISQPEHVRLLAPVADGLIVGSAFIRRAARAADGQRDAAIAEIREFAQSLLDAMK
jgi:tryptophan synthase alpha chain